MPKIMSYINNFLSAMAGFLMLLMMTILVVDILWRYFSTPLLGIAEFSVFVMMIIIYLGFARCEEHEEHVRLEFLIIKAKGRVRIAMILLTRVLALGTTAIFTYAISLDAWAAYVTNDSIEGMVNLPIWPTKFVMVFGALIFLAQMIVNLFRTQIHSNDDNLSSQSDEDLPNYE